MMLMKEPDHTLSNFIKHVLTKLSSKTVLLTESLIYGILSAKLIVTAECLNSFKNRVDLHFYEYKFMTDIKIEEAGL